MIRGEELKFKVHRKPTNKESYVHFYSGHADRVKSGVVLGFFLRAFRICSKEFLDDEIQHILRAFTKLRYPLGYLLNLKRKAINIRQRSTKTQKRDKDKRFVTIPNSDAAETISKTLEKVGVRVAFSTGKKVGEMFAQGRKDKIVDKSVVN